LITSEDFSLSEFDSMRRANLVQALKEQITQFFALFPTDPPNSLVEFHAASDLFEDMVRKVFADYPGDLTTWYLHDLRIARERRIADLKILEGKTTLV